MGIKGAAFALNGKGNHIITSRIEHHSVIGPCSFLQNEGFEVTYLPVDSRGIVDPGDVEREITSRTIMISIMHANNEIGTIEPVADIARIAHEHGILMHTDAVQTFGHIPYSIKDLGVDMMSVSAHKLYGPKGVGFLYLREGTAVVPLIHGGGQETHRRAGTHNVAGIYGLGKAVQFARSAVNNEQSMLGSMGDRLRTALLSKIDGIRINGHESSRLPGLLSVTIPGIDGDALVLGLDRKGISCSSGAACMSVNFETSHVLAAIGLSRAESKSTIRISLGRYTTAADIDHASEAIGELARSLREGVSS
jgi:cysteine desulfurase